MTQWTDTARQTFDHYCLRVRQTLTGSGADADEVIDDLRRHIDEEIRTAKLPIVTEDDMQKILGRVGEPANPTEPKTPRENPSPSNVRDEKVRPGCWLFIIGVIMPVITIGFEYISGASAGVLFDPMPGWCSVLALVLVPVANLWMWFNGRSKNGRHAKLLGWLNGLALGVCIYYSLLYLPFLPFAAMGVIFYGLGLIPLGPYFALLATPWIRERYCERIGKEKIPGLVAGPFVAIAVLIAMQIPSLVTYRGLVHVESEEPAMRRKGIRMIRAFGDRDLLLRACYGWAARREMDIDVVRALGTGGHGISPESARRAYFEVTGLPFNAVPPPSLYTRKGRWSPFEEEFTWDDAQGGEAVAGRLKGLSLTSSRLDALVEPDAALGYCEWTMEFRNVSWQQREARAQIALPPGGVVSRLTLWVNGEEREAAFAGRAQVRQAYQKIAIQQRRDPVLVTTCGPDRILMQCFPVPADGGTMKIRIGITAPLALDAAAKGRFCWPKFLERNFGLSSELKHTAWIDSPLALTAENPAFKAERPKEKLFTLHGALTEREFSENGNAITINRPAEVSSVWTPAQDSGFVIRQTLAEVKPPAAGRIVLVIDGSIGMSDAASQVARALEKLPEAIEVTALVAGDEVVALTDKPQKATADFRKTLQKKIRSFKFTGGRDNLPALEKAWDIAAETDRGRIVWIHAAQPVLVSSAESLVQRLERSAQPVRIIGFQVSPGPNRIAEKLDGFSRLTYAARFDSVENDLARELSWLSGQTARFEFQRERVAQSTEATAGKPASRHVERLWARDESARLISRRESEAAAELAAKNQLVTPVSGAVVLETKQQFDENNLKPADVKTVPSIPEPSASALLILGGAVLLFWRKITCKKMG